MRPFSHADRHNLPQLFDELFPCEGAAGEDIVVGFVNPVRQVVVGNFEIGAAALTGVFGSSARHAYDKPQSMLGGIRTLSTAWAARALGSNWLWPSSVSASK